MSGKPSPEGVTELRRLLARQRDLSSEIQKLRRDVQRLKELEEEHAHNDGSIAANLRFMDVDSLGNYGGIGRLTWFLDELDRQALAEATKNAMYVLCTCGWFSAAVPTFELLQAAVLAHKAQCPAQPRSVHGVPV